MEMFFILAGIVLLISLYIWPSSIASGKGQSGFAVFIISLLLTPLAGLIVALLMADRRDRRQ